MNATLYRNVEVLDGAANDWNHIFYLALEHGGNFLVILPEEAPALRELASQFNSGQLPDPLPRYALFSLSQFLTEQDFDTLLQVSSAGRKIIFVDQLDLTLNCPPRVKEYMVHSATYGILSHHHFLDEARRAVDALENGSFGLRPNPDECIYHWEDKWVLVED
ncbi:MAG TPA: hypothetical protein VGE41_05980 [Verrucomicrobiae bacterium]|jgi:hypothetical protein